MDHPRRRTRTGFTLLELLLVIGILAILLGLALVAIDPARRYNQSRNTTRWSHVSSLLSAIKTYQADNGGNLPGSTLDATASTAQIIGEGATCASYSCPYGLPVGLSVPASGCAVSDLDTALAAYLKAIPYDPSAGSAADTRYWINKDASGLIEIGTCNAQGEGSGGSGTPPTIRISS
jgi:prepilin-type N-terminal cleavage/methylation domain-containing protein